LKHTRWFASDNNASVHPDILYAIQQTNFGHAVGYGDDPITLEARQAFQDQFGDVEVFFVFAGTPANVLGLQSMVSSFNGVICSSVAHMNVDECGAPEKYIGCKMLPVLTTDGKITVEGLERFVGVMDNEHHVQPKVISLTQATECGTVYTPDEIKEIARFARGNDWLVHMDGARIANAAASLGTSLREITIDAGVDVLSFGGTKNGMMYGEAVIFFNTSLAQNFQYVRKQGMQLASKMRFISVQFLALLKDDLWLRNAMHANQMARLLENKLAVITQVQITQKVQANAVFAILPKPIIPRLQEEYFFYVLDETTGEVRLMTSFDTTEKDVQSFVTHLKRLVA
jgi:threonine aldolase